MSLPSNPLHVADRSVSRVINQKAIIDKIYCADGISKAQIAKELGISKPAVTSNVADLIAIGLVEEVGEGEAAKSGGRKPMILRFNESHSYIGALDLSLSEPVCAVCDLKYNMIGVRKILIGQKSSADERKQCVIDTFTGILADKGLPPGRLGIIVISQPGIIEAATGAHYANERHHGWTEIGLGRYLQNELGIPVHVRNDVNMAAMGEVHFGMEENPCDLFYVSCGIGLGAGLVLGGKLHEGGSGAAGEIGEVQMSDGSKAEDVIAMSGLIERVTAISNGAGRPDEVSFQYIVEKANENDPAVNRAIFETGIDLGRIIYNC